MTTQVVSRQLAGGSPSAGVCDLAIVNASYTFARDDAGNYFRTAVATNCNLSVQQTFNNVTTQLTNLEYTVRAAVGLNSNCVTTKPDANTRQFAAQANTNYSFALVLANAPAAGALYKLSVVFL